MHDTITRIRDCTIAAALIALAACGDSTRVTTNSVPGPTKPTYGVSDPLNGADGACLAKDAYLSGAVSGVNDSLDLADPTKNCTANDISVASADIESFSFDGVTYTTYTGQTITCNEGDPLFVQLKANIKENSTSKRTDIGAWIATDGGNARTGTCNHYNLIAPDSGTVVDGVSNVDGDYCGDLENQDSSFVELGIISTVCHADVNSDSLHIGSCLGWTEPGGDQACPQNGSLTDNSFRWGTVPGTTSKCNCSGFNINITVNKSASLEVVKACVPTTDGGTFDLQIDGVTQKDEATCTSPDNTTGKQTVSAGTNQNPGALHSFGELGGASTSLSDYTSTRVCVNRVGGAVRLASASGTGGSLTLQPDDDVVCTITNTRKPRLTLVKRIVNDNGGTAVVGDFGITTTAGSLTFGSGVADGSSTLKYTSNTLTVTAGSYTLHENDVAGYAEGTWSCTGVAGTVDNNFNTGSVQIADGENAVCTITNNDSQGSLQLVKRVVNAYGGTKTVSDFNLTTNAGALTFGSGVADGTNTLKYSSNVLPVNAGAYSLVESNVAGYTEGSWSCTGATASPTTYSGGSVTVPLGTAVVCTITNSDQPASLTIVKVVKGAGSTFGFTTTGAGLDASFSLSPATDGSDSKTYTGLSAGVRTITEDASSYLLTDLGCDDQPIGTYDPALTRTVSTTLTNGGSVTCTFVNEAPANTTRTQGFWATHKSITYAAWFGGSVGGNTFSGVSDKTLCAGPTKNLDTIGKVLGGFWSSISFTTTKTKRTSLDQARMQLIQQLLAAMLNNAAFGSSPSGGISIAQAEAAYCGTDVTAIKNAASAMAAFNSSGDNGIFTPGVSANGKLAKGAANLAYWDILP